MNAENLSTQTTRFRRGMTIVITMGVTLAAVLICIQLLANAPIAHTAGTINVTTTNDEYDTAPNATCSLREAIQSINTNASFGGCTNPGAADTIQLQADTYTLSIAKIGVWDDSNQGGSLAPDAAMTILGAGADQTIVSATATFTDRVVFVDANSNPGFALTIQGMTIQGGDLTTGSDHDG